MARVELVSASIWNLISLAQMERRQNRVALLARDENKYSSFVLHMFSKLSIMFSITFQSGKFLLIYWRLVEKLSHFLIDTGRSYLKYCFS